jgi:hypothetical protein
MKRFARLLLAASPLLVAALPGCGGSTETPRPARDGTGGPQGVPGYLSPPSGVSIDDTVPVDCYVRADVELELIEDFELGAAGGWYLSNDVCADCQDFVNAADAIRNAGEATSRAAELTDLQSQLDACRPTCLAALQVPNYFDNPPVSQPIPGGRCDSRYAMHIKGGPFVEWGGNMGFAFAPPLNVTAFDIENGAGEVERPGRDLHGITFWARLGGASNNNLRIELGDRFTDQAYDNPETPEADPICNPNTTDANSDEGCDKFGAITQMRDDWQQFFVPFAEMRQQGWGRRAEYFDLTALLSFSVFYAQGTWDFWIDDLAFYRRKP